MLQKNTIFYSSYFLYKICNIKRIARVYSRMVPEKELVSKVLAGDARAFKRLVEQYQRLVLHVSSRMIRNEDDLSDVCQEVFIKVHKGLGTFTFQSKLSTWIARIAYLTSVNHLRKYKNDQLNRSTGENDELDNLHFTEHTPERILIRKDVNAYVHHLIAQLPLNYRTVLTLYHLQEFSYQEIEEITGMPEGTVKNYLFRAKKLLREKLELYLKHE